MAASDIGQDEPSADERATAESGERDTQAEDRDRAAEDRDRAAEGRDRAAEGRDQQAADHDAAAGRVADTRHPYRKGARDDRLSSARDRGMASADRAAAARDRAMATSEIESLVRDELTGAYRRREGLAEIVRDIKKAHRTHEPLTLAFIDVDGLKAINDTYGHQEGDRVLARVAAAIRSVVRDYDLIVRFGGDEFLCETLGLPFAEAQSRYDKLNDVLAATGRGSASVGMVQLAQDESLEQLIARADTAMFARKRHRG